LLRATADQRFVAFAVYNQVIFFLFPQSLKKIYKAHVRGETHVSMFRGLEALQAWYVADYFILCAALVHVLVLRIAGFHELADMTMHMTLSLRVSRRFAVLSNKCKTGAARVFAKLAAQLEQFGRATTRAAASATLEEIICDVKEAVRTMRAAILRALTKDRGSK
jgi:hypothetical protein